MVAFLSGINTLGLNNHHLYLGEAMAEVIVNDYMPKIWNDLVDAFGNEIGVAGLMGNLYAESGCTPYACQPSRPYDVCMTYINNVNNHAISENQFVYGGCSSAGGYTSTQLGFGLAQWTFYSRKQGFYDYVFDHSSNIGNLQDQIDYVIKEITDNSDWYNAVTQATDLDTVSDYLMLNFENPQDKSIEAKKVRRSYSSDIYDEYNGTVPVEPVNPQPPSTDYSPIPREPILLKKSMPLWMMIKNKRNYAQEQDR